MASFDHRPSGDQCLSSREQRWALILAGGDGLRLRSLTRIIAGDDRPKQFCRILGHETLLETTQRRVSQVVPASRTLLVLTRTQEPYYVGLVQGMPARSLVIQPANCGTAPAILYGALRIAAEAPLGAVALLPTDHYVSDDERFMSHVSAAFDAVHKRPELVVLLGLAPESAETEYGWIEPAHPVPGTPLFTVGRFWEKPPAALAEELLRRDCLWNSFVLVARIPALLALFGRFVPALTAAFDGVRSRLGSADEDCVMRTVYAGLEPAGFSDAVLSAHPANLATLPVHGVRWSDWGHPRRILTTLEELGATPEWAEHAALTIV